MGFLWYGFLFGKGYTMITIVTLYRHHDAEHYVGVVQGRVGQQDRDAMKAGYSLQPGDTIGFVETTPQANLQHLTLDECYSGGSVGIDPVD